jgi:hypothetical protein
VPEISSFYGVTVYLFVYDISKHHLPHIHVKYGEYKAGIDIKEGNILYGRLPRSKMKLVQAWIEIHKKDLAEDWKLAEKGEKPFKIEPLK